MLSREQVEEARRESRDVCVRTGRVLDKLLKVNDMTGRSLAKELGVSNTAVSRWIRGENSPSFQAAIEIADFFGITLYELCGRDKMDSARLSEIREHVDATYGKRRREELVAKYAD